MGMNHFETSDCGLRNSDFGFRNSNRDRGKTAAQRHSAIRDPQSAFTLTELLVVITIIAILAALITGAAINALNRAKQVAITQEIMQLGNSLEDFKNTYGAYPPNVFTLESGSPLNLTNPEKNLAASDLIRFMKKCFPRSAEFQVNTSGAIPQRNNVPAIDNLYPVLEVGLTPAEAIVFWLQGFSNDTQRPLSGTDLEAKSIDDNGTTINDVITIESFTPRYDFDRGRLRISRDASGNRRYIDEVYRADGSGPFQIQLYEYLASGSQEPLLYFDTSRRSPAQTVKDFPHNPNPMNVPGHEKFYKTANGSGCIVPFKQIVANSPQPLTDLKQIEYVNPRTFQILHCGIDDIWGNMCYDAETGTQLSQLDGPTNFPNLLFPTGPFLGDVADTVSNFFSGPLADEQE